MENQQKISLLIAEFAKELDAVPGWKEWQRKKFRYTIDPELADRGESIPQEFVFPPGVTAQHDLVFNYLSMADTLSSLRDLEFYFRRYPFRGLPVSRYSHLINVCEMFFGRFYEFRERLKKTCNSLNRIIHPKAVNVGALLKLYDKDFDQEIRERNSSHHHTRFVELQLDRIRLAELLAQNDRAKDVLGRTYHSEYRRLCREWALRVRQRSSRVEAYLEATASAILEHAHVLNIRR